MCLWKRERTYLFLPFWTTLVRQPHYAGGRCADKLEEYTAVLGNRASLNSIAGTYYDVLPSDVWNNTHIKCWWYLLVDTDIQRKAERAGKVKRFFPSAWRQHIDACASFEWWQYFTRRRMLFCKYHLFYLFNGFYVSSWIGLKLKGMAFCVWYRIITYNICRIGL